MIYATCLIIMFILSQKTITFSDFPVNIWVASFIVYAFYGSTFFQSGLYIFIYKGSAFFFYLWTPHRKLTDFHGRKKTRPKKSRQKHQQLKRTIFILTSFDNSIQGQKYNNTKGKVTILIGMQLYIMHLKKFWNNFDRLCARNKTNDSSLNTILRHTWLIYFFIFNHLTCPNDPYKRSGNIIDFD